jgi:nucleoside-diphosphate-sugar epimerase
VPTAPATTSSTSSGCERAPRPVARALIVGCGCRGRALGARLVDYGWLVRGTTRDEARLAGIEGAGIEPALADPDRAATILDHVGDVAVLFWLLGSAVGEPASVAAIHGGRLERVLEKLVDSPVRGFVYEAVGSVPARELARGTGIARAAGARWRIPVAVVDADPGAPDRWVAAMAAAATEVASAGSA